MVNVNIENLNRTMAENGKLANKFIGAYQRAIRNESFKERYETGCITNTEAAIRYVDIDKAICESYENAGQFLCILNSISRKAGAPILDGYLDRSNISDVAAICNEVDQWYFNNSRTYLSETTRRFKEENNE